MCQRVSANAQTHAQASTIGNTMRGCENIHTQTRTQTRTLYEDRIANNKVQRRARGRIALTHTHTRAQQTMMNIEPSSKHNMYTHMYTHTHMRTHNAHTHTYANAHTHTRALTTHNEKRACKEARSAYPHTKRHLSRPRQSRSTLPLRMDTNCGHLKEKCQPS